MTISYTWKRSRNNVIFSVIPGATDEEFIDVGLTSSTPIWYQRVARNNETGEVAYSNVVLAPLGPMTIESDVQNLAVSSLVELFVFDYTALGGEIVRFHAGTNELKQAVIWQGYEYQPFPVDASGFELSGRGTLPRPTVRVANVTGLITALCSAYEDLLGATLTRKRTLLKYLDAVNFESETNPTADPTQHLPDQVWTVNRKSVETSEAVEFELAAAFDAAGKRLPGGQVFSNVCRWKYRSAECSYIGGPVATRRDAPTSDPTLDDCSKSIRGCKFRFGEHGELKYGSFPGAGLTR